MKTWNYTRLDLYTYIETPDGKSRNLLNWIRNIVYGIYFGLCTGVFIILLMPSTPYNIIMIFVAYLVLYGKNCMYIGWFILKIWGLIVSINWNKFPDVCRGKIKIYKTYDYYYSIVAEAIYGITISILLVISLLYFILLATNSITITNADRIILRLISFMFFFTLDSNSTKSIIDEILFI